MKLNYKYLSLFIIASQCFYMHPLLAQNTSSYAVTSSEDPSSSTDSTQLLQQIKDGLYNWGSFAGFDVSNPAQSINSSLISLNDQSSIEINAVKTLFYIMSANSTFPNFFVSAPYTALNGLSAQIFSSNQQAYAPINNVDLPSSIQNPVAQTLMNILSITPDTACFTVNNDNAAWASNCTYSYTEGLNYATALGLDVSSFPKVADVYNTNAKMLQPTSFYPSSSNSSVNQYLLNQIDSSIFISPLIYGNSNDNDSNNSQQSSNVPAGLNNTNSMQAARNFVRYVTGTILPKSLSSTYDIQDRVNSITSSSSTYRSQLKAFKELTKYLLGLRVYAAQLSFPVQNFYEYLNSRAPITSSSSGEGASNTQTSQALNEFVMASYRLYNPGGDNNYPSTWQTRLDSASPATVQKEIALLLAEMNYQLYQMRQTQEKILLTNSISLINSISPPNINSNSSED